MGVAVFFVFSSVLVELDIVRNWFWPWFVDAALWNSAGPGIITITIIVWAGSLLLVFLLFQVRMS